MPFNSIKKYPELLELMHLGERERKKDLRDIFDRDITDNPSFIFNKKVIRPTKKDGQIDLGNVFNHLITEDFFEEGKDGKKIKRRQFESHRAHRLHWLKTHVDNNIKNLELFSVEERDQRKRKNIVRTYILNLEEKYVVILEPQNSNQDYYLITAYYLNKKYGLKQMKKKAKKKLPNLY